MGRSGNVVGLVGEPGNDRLRTRVTLYCRSTRQGGQGTVEALEPSRVRCRLVGFGRVASKVTRLPVKPDRVRKYLSGMHYQYTPLYPVSVSGPGGSTTPGLWYFVIHHIPAIYAFPHRKPELFHS